jgi:methionyl-tRNA formyltransferase
MYICIAGKNKCAVDIINYLRSIKKIKKNILALPNRSDNGIDGWQKSFRKHAKNNKIKIVNLNHLYKIKNLIFFSIEYEKLIDPNKFKTNKLFNIHFSILPKYRGCHTNYYQIMNGEKYSGVTLHKIDSGIDSGDIISQLKFKININDTAYDNYKKLIKYSVILFKNNIKKIMVDNYKFKKQNLRLGSYFSRRSVDYNKIKNIDCLNNSLKIHNKIRSLIFPAFQLPIVNGMKVKKSVYKNNKIYLYD